MKKTERYLLVLLFSAAVMTVVWHYLSPVLNFEALKSHQETLRELVLQHYPLALISYFLLYVLIATLSIPLTFLLTLAGGAFFGVLVGGGVSLLAYSIGATFSFALVRAFFREPIRRKFSKQLAAAQLVAARNGLEKDDAFFLFSLRMVPGFPHLITNFLMAMTEIKVKTFFTVTVLGSVLLIFIYAHAGLRLSELKSLDEILSLKLIIALGLVALAPFISRFILRLLTERLRTAAKQKQNKKYRYRNSNSP